MNKAGIYPAGSKILVKPDPVKETIGDSPLVLPESEREKYECGQASGTLVAVGPDFCRHVTERDSSGGITSTRGYSEPFARVGERVAFAKYGGLRCQGGDGENYVILNDEDITARIEDGVKFTDLPREGVGR